MRGFGISMLAPLLLAATSYSKTQRHDDNGDNEATTRFPEETVESEEDRILRTPCSRCKAPPGQECDKRTLGRRRFHRARVEAAGVEI